MNHYKVLFVSIIAMSFMACTHDDDPIIGINETTTVVLPNVAITGFDVTTGDAPYLLQWDENYENAQVDFLPELLGYGASTGILNIEEGTMAIGVGFPINEVIFYDINADTSERYTNYFSPINPVAGNYTLQTGKYIVTYYLDQDTCCNIYLNSYNIETGETIETYVGNIDIIPLVTNLYVQNNKAFVSGIDTFTGVKRLYVFDLDLGIPLGAVEVEADDGYIYNNVREEIYLFDFEGNSLQYETLDLTTFAIGEPQEFTAGVTALSGFNEVMFLEDKMIFKQTEVVQGSIALSAIYNFTTEDVISFDSLDLINRIAEIIGTSINITDTAVDISSEVYVIAGTYVVDQMTNENRGVLILMDYNREILKVVETENINPQQIILLD